MAVHQLVHATPSRSPNILISPVGEILRLPSDIASATKVHKIHETASYRQAAVTCAREVRGRGARRAQVTLLDGVIHVRDPFAAGPNISRRQSFRLDGAIRTEDTAAPRAGELVVPTRARRQSSSAPRQAPRRALPARDCRATIAYFVRHERAGFAREYLGALRWRASCPRAWTSNPTVPTERRARATKAARRSKAHATTSDRRQLDGETRSLQGRPPSSERKKKPIGNGGVIGRRPRRRHSQGTGVDSGALAVRAASSFPAAGIAARTDRRPTSLTPARRAPTLARALPSRRRRRVHYGNEAARARSSLSPRGDMCIE